MSRGATFAVGAKVNENDGLAAYFMATQRLESARPRSLLSSTLFGFFDRCCSACQWGHDRVPNEAYTNGD